uniref:DNA polymerase alpha subunit B N-terminal domain-containing protein n=1 Tax=Anopheles albimanus TaxID=7167 RepID=A0A182FAD6_ANOAL
MVSIETIKEQFDELGIEPSDEVVDRCIEICLNNNIDDPVEFVEQWMAYSVSKLSGAEPTIAYLNEMEANEYTSKARKMGKASSMAGAGPNSLASPRLDSKVSKLTTYRNVDSVEQDVLQMYGCNTPKVAYRSSQKPSLFRAVINFGSMPSFGGDKIKSQNVLPPRVGRQKAPLRSHPLPATITTQTLKAHDRNDAEELVKREEDWWPDRRKSVKFKSFFSWSR